MKIVPVAEVKARLSHCLEACTSGPVIVTKNGRPAAVLVAASDEAELERVILAHTPRFMKILDGADKRLRQGRGVSHREVWKAVGKARNRT